jgi:hypothetical protein
MTSRRPVPFWMHANGFKVMHDAWESYLKTEAINRNILKDSKTTLAANVTLRKHR